MARLRLGMVLEKVTSESRRADCLFRGRLHSASVGIMAWL